MINFTIFLQSTQWFKGAPKLGQHTWLYSSQGTVFDFASEKKMDTTGQGKQLLLLILLIASFHSYPNEKQLIANVQLVHSL